MRRLQALLASEADSSYAATVHKYMKGIMPCRGVKMPEIRRTVEQWKLQQPDNNTKLAQCMHTTGYQMIRQKHLEDKFAGCMLLQDSYCTPTYPVSIKAELHGIAALFEDGHVFGWAATDILCQRVISRLITRTLNPDVEEKDMDVQQAVGAVTMWAGAENIWKARAACVAMLTWADKKEELFDGFRDVLLQTAAINIQNQERYVGKADNPALMSFCDTHLEYFTPEGLRYALEKQPNAALKQYTARLKDLKSDSKKDAQEQAQKPAKKVKKSPNISVQKDSERVRTRTRSGRVERSTTSKSQVVGGAQGGQMKRASSCDNSKNGLDNNDSTGNGNAVKHRRMRRRKT